MAPKVYISTLTFQDFIHFSILFSISTHKVLMKLYLLSPKLFLLIANAAKLQRLPTLRNAGTLGALRGWETVTTHQPSPVLTVGADLQNKASKIHHDFL